MNPVQNSLVILARLDRKLQTQESANKSLTGFKIQEAFTIISRWTKPLGSAKQAQNQAGYCKSLNAPWELFQLALRRDYAKKIDPCRMLVWIGRRTVPQDRVSTRCYLSGRYKLGRSCSNSNLLRGQSDNSSQGSGF